MSVDSITMYADYVCPFCYLGRTSLERYRTRRDQPLAVEWHPFDLRAGQRDESGEVVHESGPDDAYYEQAWQNVERLAEEYDVDVPDEPIIDVDSLPAQRVSLFVRDAHPDEWMALDRALYGALWKESLDIGDPAVLDGIVQDVGLDEAIVRKALSDDALRSQLDEYFVDARRRGITGVPTFVNGDNVTRGAVSPELIRRLVEGAD